ncbi:MFS transporter [Actinomycetospora lutea]|uniref:MFS transporter n=1 Tax=Actinomycetospora lutea TaxID=663604 RepID=UPI002365F6EB|nr:MFS transporter [Actinomycetospora lutea]MDD7937014.1 MFS transporter [Actinomycetospora lutea]
MSAEIGAGTGPATGTATATSPPTIGRARTLLLAVLCGAAVANIYYAQPLLHTIGEAFGVGDGTAGLLVTASQVGYAAALALLVPLGDLLERRRLVTVLLAACAVVLALAAAAPAFGLLAAAIALVGVTSAVAQIAVPLAASLAGDHERGQVVGTVMSGLLIGILGARTVAGFVAEAGGWRWVFGAAAGVMVLLAAVVRLGLPVVPPTESATYPRLLRTVLELVRDQPELRRRMALGAVGMGCFTILWTSIDFLLSAPPYGYGPAVVGLFGLAGLAGAAMAVLAGKLADRGHQRLVVTLGLIVLAASWGLLGLGGVSLVALIAGVVVLDLCQQALQISHQSVIYALAPEARSRVTTAFMVSAFAGGTLASAATALIYPVGGWLGVCVLGGAIALLGVAVWFLPRT